jgi:acetyl-CoA carboxylase carboxyl transferase subunit alpha
LAKRTFLDFEQPIADLEGKIEELRYVQTESAVDISEEIDQLSKKSQQLTKDIYRTSRRGRSPRLPAMPSVPTRWTMSTKYSPISSNSTAIGTLPTT